MLYSFYLFIDDKLVHLSRLFKNRKYTGCALWFWYTKHNFFIRFVYSRINIHWLHWYVFDLLKESRLLVNRDKLVTLRAWAQYSPAQYSTLYQSLNRSSPKYTSAVRVPQRSAHCPSDVIFVIRRVRRHPCIQSTCSPILRTTSSLFPFTSS